MKLSFFSGGGEMGALMRSFDWTTTPIGSPDSWPQGLRTAVRILLTTQHPMFIWWGPDLIQFYNDAYRKTMGPERHPSALGQRGRECWQEIWDIIGPQIELVMSGGGATWHEDQLVPVTRYGRREDVWWTYSFGPIDDEASESGVGGVLVVCKDVTGTRRAFQALEASEERLRLALSAGLIGTWDWHVEGDRVYADERCARFYGLSPEQATAGAPPRNYMHAVHVDDRQRLRESIDRAVRTGEEFIEEYRIVQPDDAVRWVAARGRCYYGADRKPLRFPGAVTDITEQKRANEHRQMLTEELNHRVKNMLTTVQAIARQTLKSGVSIAAARETLDARLMALSRAHDVLVGKSWAGAHIETVITNAVEPHAVDAERFQMDGPSLRIASRPAFHLALTLHELATNAAKYGALSMPEGRVDIGWRIDRDPHGAARFVMTWRETGGPPVIEPKRKGFGSRLIEGLLAGELNAKAAIAYEPSGAVCTIDAPLATIQEAEQ